ncbi:MAG: SpvB/TcaC N-terminal domain-containing protein [Polyangiaceae bacterium]
MKNDPTTASQNGPKAPRAPSSAAESGKEPSRTPSATRGSSPQGGASGGSGGAGAGGNGTGPGSASALLPAVSAPKGGGALRGIGEKFSVNAATGTASLAVPIATSPGRSGFGPELSLSYDSGSGNGPFGMGFNFVGARGNAEDGQRVASLLGRRRVGRLRSLGSGRPGSGTGARRGTAVPFSRGWLYRVPLSPARRGCFRADRTLGA